MRSALIIARPNLNHQSTWGTAFGQGLAKHGWKSTMGVSYAPCDLLVMWGVRRLEMITMQKAHGGEVCILERGYLDDRFSWSSVSFGGGLNGRGRFRGPFEDGSRWAQHFAPLLRDPKPAKAGDRLALIMGQVASDSAVRNVDIFAWYQRAEFAFRKHGFKTRIRQHPQALRCGEKQRPLLEDLAAADCVVTWNSNSGVDAVLAGVPTVAMDKGSMAYAVAGHDLAPPELADRTAWAHALAWKQWRIPELASGACWAAVKGEL